MTPRPPEPPRSDRWPAARAAWLLLHNHCAMCGATTFLEVHHIRPFHLFPALELDPTNFITLCEGREECHFNVGHLRNWRSYNPHLLNDPTLKNTPGTWSHGDIQPAQSSGSATAKTLPLLDATPAPAPQSPAP